MRFSTLKIVIITSLFWIMVHIMIIHYMFPSSINTGAIKEKIKQIYQPVLTEYSHYGANGEAVIVPEHMRERSKKTFETHQFNLVASDLIGASRNIPDHRNVDCKAHEFHSLSDLSPFATSVIIVFHNEAWSTLIRTINSVIQRTPSEILHEILLVDDKSDMEHLGNQLDNYVAIAKVKMKIIRMPERKGLIVARLKGASEATGKTLTFLDAHCEVTTTWLEPLLEEILIDRKTIASPIIDIISEETFQYIAISAERTWGGFDWSLGFHWEHTARSDDKRTGYNHDHSSPILTPAMAGGLFTVEKDYFYEIGSYDEGMEIWGGENVEISIRVWTCGGRLLIHPCSRVGHVFRNKSPYSWPGGVSRVISRNVLRTAMVWLDEYLEMYLEVHPDARRFTEVGDLNSRKQLRQNLHCKPFKWYLKEIYPESSFPLDIVAAGEVRAVQQDLCLDTMGHSLGQSILPIACHHAGGNQVAVFSSAGRIQFSTGCLEILPGKGGQLRRCKQDRLANQKFDYDQNKKTLRHVFSTMCLDVQAIEAVPTLRLAKCSANVTQWDMKILKNA